jgi:hypothetical protein
MSENPIKVIDNVIEIDVYKMEIGKHYIVDYDGSKYRYSRTLDDMLVWEEIG